MSYKGLWNPNEVDILRRLYPKTSKSEILEALPRRSWPRIQNKASKLKIKRLFFPNQYRGVSWRWTEEKVAILRDLYPRSPKEEVLKALPDHLWDSIQSKAKTLEIRRSRWVYLSQKSMLIPSLVDTVYTVGILDGEGSIGIWIDTKSKYLHPLVTISNNYIPLLEWLVRVFGIGSFGRVHGRTFQWRIVAINDILQFLRLLLPYLKIKRRQAELLIEYCELEKQNIMEYVSNNKRPYSPRQWEIYEELKKLNKRGPRAAPPLKT